MPADLSSNISIVDPVSKSGKPRKTSATCEHPTEAQIQRSIVDFLAVALPLSYRAIAIPNAARRGKGKNAANAVAGLTPGVYDLLIFGPGGRAYSIEVKRHDGTLSPSQHAWRSFLWSINAPEAVARSVDDVRAALQAWGIQTREARR